MLELHACQAIQFRHGLSSAVSTSKSTLAERGASHYGLIATTSCKNLPRAAIPDAPRPPTADDREPMCRPIECQKVESVEQQLCTHPIDREGPSDKQEPRLKLFQEDYTPALEAPCQEYEHCSRFDGLSKLCGMPGRVTLSGCLDVICGIILGCLHRVVIELCQFHGLHETLPQTSKQRCDCA